MRAINNEQLEGFRMKDELKTVCAWQVYPAEWMLATPSSVMLLSLNLYFAGAMIMIWNCHQNYCIIAFRAAQDIQLFQ